MGSRQKAFCLRLKPELLEDLKLKALKEKISLNKLIKKRLFGDKW